MFLPKWFCDFYFYVGPVSSPKVMVELTPRLVRGFIGVNPIVGNAIEGNAGREFGVFLQRALVFEVEVAAVIDGVGAWVAEQCIERCCRYLLLTGRARRFQCEMAEAEPAKKAPRGIMIGVQSVAVVRRRTVERGKKEPRRTATVVGGAGEKQVHPVKPLAIGGPPFVRAKTVGLACQRHPLEVVDVAGNHIDHGKECVGSIQRAARTTNDFHAVNQIKIELKISADQSAVVEVVGEAMAIQQQQNAGVVVTRPRESAHADVAIISVIADIESPHAAENVGQGAVTALAYLVRGRGISATIKLRSQLRSASSRVAAIPGGNSAAAF